jgi:hypothetical protein
MGTKGRHNVKKPKGLGKKVEKLETKKKGGEKNEKV